MKIEDLLLECPEGATSTLDGSCCSPLEVLLTLLLLDLLVPFFFNYVLTWIVWSKMDKQKTFTWLACALAFYPQMRAAAVIRHILIVIVMCFLVVRAASRPEDYPLVIGKKGSWDEAIFFTTFSTSIITASLGLAKPLKIGTIC